MSCPAQVVVQEIGCSTVAVATPGPQGIQGVAGSSNYTTPTTVEALPGAVQGTRAFVTDATSTVFGSVVAGGGSNAVPVFYDGTYWRIG